MAGIQIDGVNNKIDFDDDLDTSISANTDDTLVFEIAGATDFTMTANTFTAASGSDVVLTGTTTGAQHKAFWDSSNNSLDFGDSTQLRFGASADLKIYHDGTNSYIVDSGTGNLKISAADLQIMNAASSELMIQGIQDGAVTLYHNNIAKLATTATGATVTGTATVGALSDGTVTKSKIAFHLWKLAGNLSVSTGAADITANMTQVEAVGSVLSVSSGVFTFPYIGKWRIQYQILSSSSPAAVYRGGAISATTDGSNFSEIRNGFTSNTASTYFALDINYTFDVTNVSTHKVKFRVENGAGGTISQGTNFSFTYLGDT